jgi:hypothetical protein
MGAQTIRLALLNYQFYEGCGTKIEVERDIRFWLRNQTEEEIINLFCMLFFSQG